MLSSRTISISLLLLLICCCTVVAQPRRPAPPNIKPGTIVDVDDWGEIKVGEFVEVTRQGWIKVRFENGEEKDFWAKDVRVSKTKKLKGKTAKGAGAIGALSGPRTWSDASGKFKIEASFVSLAGGKVELKKTDGSTVAVPLDKLSSADQDIARSLASGGGSGASGGDENPFEAAGASSGTGSTVAASQPEGAASDEPAVIQGNASDARLIDLTASEYRVPALEAKATPKLTDKGIALPNKKVDPRNHAAFREVFLETPGDYLFVDAYRNQMWCPIQSEPGPRKVPVRIERIDLANGKHVGSLEFPPIKEILAVDASGKLVIARSFHEITESSMALDLYRVTGSKVARVMQFQPAGNGGTFRGDSIIAASVVGTAHLLTSTSTGETVLWKLPEMSGVYRLSLGTACSPPALSADQKVMAVGTESGVYVLDPLTGQVLGKMEGDGASRDGQLAFDPSGTRLLHAHGSGVSIYDVSTGKLIRHAKTPVVFQERTPIGIISDRYVYAGNSLIDMELAIVLCKYSPSVVGGMTYYGGRLWALLVAQGDGALSQKGLAHFALPQPEAVAKTDGLTRESFLAVKPGEKVGLQLNLSFSSGEMEQIKQALVKTIQDNGWVYSDDSPVAVITSEVRNESRQATFRSFRGETQNVTLTDYFGSVQLKKGDKTVWQTGAAWHAPTTVFAKEGGAAEEVAKHKPDWKFFQGAKVPKEAIVYPEGGALCSATITAKGVETK